jgi:hypothetical protein
MTVRPLHLVATPERFFTREQLAKRLGVSPRQVTRMGLPRYPGRRGGLYVWEEVVAEMQRRRERKEAG